MAPFARSELRLAAGASTCAALLLLAACGSGSTSDPGPIAVAPCAGNACAQSGVVTGPGDPPQLCPTSLDFGTTFTGGAGSGEYVRLKFDTSKKQYQLTFVESEVPTSAGQVNTTRAGLTITGSFENPNLYRVTDTQGNTSTPLALPTAEQNRCSFVLKDGRTADGSYVVTVAPNDPPMVFVGNGIAGGSIPGATIQFHGVDIVPGVTVGAVPAKHFDYYPFVAFAQTFTDFGKVAGDYNELGIRFTPTGGNFQSRPGDPTQLQLGWQVDPVNTSETLHADGSCSADAARSPTACATTGGNWTRRLNTDGSPDVVFRSDALPNPGTYPQYPDVGTGVMQAALGPNLAHGIMIVGNMGGQPVPVIIRVGYAFAGAAFAQSTIDDQIGISLLSPVARLAPSDFKGAFIGANSVSACGVVSAYSLSANGEGACLDDSATGNAGINYTSTIFEGTSAAFLDPFKSRAAANFALDYTQTQAGVVRVAAGNPFVSGSATVFQQGDTGALIKVGPVFGLLMNGSGLPNPFFTIGAFVQ